MEGIYTLNFYSLKITKYLEKIVRASERELGTLLWKEEK